MKSNKGFTLIELTVVMGVMALLLALAVPAYLGYTKDVKVLEMQQDCKVLQDELLKIKLKGGEIAEGPLTTPPIPETINSSLNNTLTEYKILTVDPIVVNINTAIEDSDGNEQVGIPVK